MNNLMERIYSAIENEECPVLDQLHHDIQLAKEQNGLTTEEYDMVPSGNDVIIKDKIHDELTRVHETSDGGYNLTDEGRTEFNVGDSVQWVDSSGSANSGVISTINGRMATVDYNGKLINVSLDKLNLLSDPITAEYSYVVRNNNLIGYVPCDIANNVAKAFSATTTTKFNISDYCERLNNKFSKLSEDNQRLFTRQSRRYAVLNKLNKLQHIVDIDRAKSLVKEHQSEGWYMIKEVEFNKMNQSAPKAFSI